MPGGVAEFVVLNEEDLDTPDVSQEDTERNPLESLFPDFIIRALQVSYRITLESTRGSAHEYQVLIDTRSYCTPSSHLSPLLRPLLVHSSNVSSTM